MVVPMAAAPTPITPPVAIAAAELAGAASATSAFVPARRYVTFAAPRRTNTSVSLTIEEELALREELRSELDVALRFKAPALLAAGAISGILGFAIAFVIGVVKFHTRKVDETGRQYSSGNGYWPSTVSEQVYKWNSPEGRIFFGFEFVSALLIFQSWYPYALRNVYTGHSSPTVFSLKPMYWITFRQLVPVVGLLLLICVSTVPAEEAMGVDNVSMLVHLFGAGMMFVGYILSELKCLALCGFSSKKAEEYLDIEPLEYDIRKALMCITLTFYGLFCFIQVVMLLPIDVCCEDQYRDVIANITVMDVQDAHVDFVPMRLKSLINTASGPYLFMKMASYTTEVIAGLAVVCSHLVVWWFCEERHVEYARSGLREVYDEENCEQVYFNE